MSVSSPPKQRYAIPTMEELFEEYDQDGNGYLTKEEFQQLLWDIDGLDGVPLKSITDYVEAEFEKADLNHDEFISIDEFALYYYAELCFKFPIYKNGFNPGARLYNLFVAYCSFGKGVRRCEEMEGHCFARLCKDCKLLESCECGKASVDIVFHRVRADRVYSKELGATKLQFPEFLLALQKIGIKLETGLDDVINKVLGNGRCRREHTMADFVVLDALSHAAKEERAMKEWKPPSHASGSQHQEVPRARGPLSPLEERPNDRDKMDSIEDEVVEESEGKYSDDSFEHSALERLPSAGAQLVCDENEAAPKKSKWAYETLGHFKFGACGKEALEDCGVLWKVRQLDEDDITMALKRVFEKYNMWEHGANRSRMNKMRFHKVLRDAAFVNRHLTSENADHIFSKVRPASEYNINFIQFIEGLRFIAIFSRLSLNEVMERVVAVGGPIT